MFKIDIYFKNLQKCKLNISGIEPEALGLKVHCSTTELYNLIVFYKFILSKRGLEPLYLFFRN